MVVLATSTAAHAVKAAPNVSDKAREQHEEISGPFEDGRDVTDTCLECHEDAARDFMQTSHWTWEAHQQVYGRGPIATGKRHAINNFCYGVASNLSKCTECHAGYGWKDNSFDFDDPLNVDCLVCHDTTGTYRRLGGDGGVADPATDFEFVARNVGMPTRANCGVCHFFAGSGHAVKHGDLEQALVNPPRSLDVHMSADAGDFACQRCHVTQAHRIRGSAIAASPGGGDDVRCTDCHELPVHADKPLLDQHALSVACQTCHIPRFARGAPTKLNWDWSTAGTVQEETTNAQGLPQYVPYKGSFKWGSDVVPTYAWFNGLAGIHAWGEPIDPSTTTALNWPVGGKDDAAALIYPFKVHRGRQIYDSQHDYLINPLLVTREGFVYTQDWDSAARIGMAARGLDYSGSFGFADTLMYLRVNHTVPPADQALICGDCHGRAQNRMDWRALGYRGDPLYIGGESRHPMQR